MPQPLRRLALIAAAAAGLAGCVTPPRIGTINGIGNDSAAFSLAYARSANNQVLLNVLEARDRLPRHYLTMSGISDAPTASYSGGVSLNPLGSELGVPPLSASGLTAGASVSTHPTYGVTPLTPDNLAKAVYAPLAPARFEYYWRINWADDVLIYLMARNVSHGHCTNLSSAEIAAAGAIRLARKSGPSPAGACDFHEDSSGPAALDELIERIHHQAPAGSGASRDPKAFQARGMAAAALPSGAAALMHIGDRDCHIVTSADSPEGRLELLKLATGNKDYGYEEHTPEHGAAGPTVGVLKSCSGDDWDALVFANGPQAEIYVVEQRSVDEIVYYLGHIARGEAAPPMVLAPGAPPGSPPVPLFVLSEGSAPLCGADPSTYAASLAYGGRRYWAGPPVPPHDHAGCSYAEAHDRTATVITLLTQLYALQATPDALNPPVRFIVQ